MLRVIKIKILTRHYCLLVLKTESKTRIALGIRGKTSAETRVTPWIEI